MQGADKEAVKQAIKEAVTEALEEYFRAHPLSSGVGQAPPNTGLNGMSFKTDAVSKHFTPKQSPNGKTPT